MTSEFADIEKEYRKKSSKTINLIVMVSAILVVLLLTSSVLISSSQSSFKTTVANQNPVQFSMSKNSKTNRKNGPSGEDKEKFMNPEKVKDKNINETGYSNTSDSASNLKNHPDFAEKPFIETINNNYDGKEISDAGKMNSKVEEVKEGSTYVEETETDENSTGIEETKADGTSTNVEETETNENSINVEETDNSATTNIYGSINQTELENAPIFIMNRKQIEDENLSVSDKKLPELKFNLFSLHRDGSVKKVEMLEPLTGLTAKLVPLYSHKTRKLVLKASDSENSVQRLCSLSAARNGELVIEQTNDVDLDEGSLDCFSPNGQYVLIGKYDTFQYKGFISKIIDSSPESFSFESSKVINLPIDYMQRIFSNDGNSILSLIRISGQLNQIHLIKHYLNEDQDRWDFVRTDLPIIGLEAIFSLDQTKIVDLNRTEKEIEFRVFDLEAPDEGCKLVNSLSANDDDFYDLISFHQNVIRFMSTNARSGNFEIFSFDSSTPNNPITRKLYDEEGNNEL